MQELLASDFETFQAAQGAWAQKVGAAALATGIPEGTEYELIVKPGEGLVFRLK